MILSKERTQPANARTYFKRREWQNLGPFFTLTAPLHLVILPPLFFMGGGAMKKRRAFAVKIVAIANAILLVAAFVGCPSRKDPTIMPFTIAPPPPDFQRLLPSDNTAPPPQGSNNDKRTP